MIINIKEIKNKFYGLPVNDVFGMQIFEHQSDLCAVKTAMKGKKIQYEYEYK